MDKLKDLLFEEKERLTAILKAVDLLIEAYKEPSVSVFTKNSTTTGALSGGTGLSEKPSFTTNERFNRNWTYRKQVYYVVSGSIGSLSLKEIKDGLSSYGATDTKYTASCLIKLLKEKKIKRSGIRKKYRYFT